MYKCYSINSYGIINDCKFDISGSLVIMVKLTNEWTSCNLMSKIGLRIPQLLYLDLWMWKIEYEATYMLHELRL